MTASTVKRLAVDDLSVAIAQSSTDVIAEISFEVEAGEILGVVGESGSGKTTMGLALLGYTRKGLQIAGGSVLINGTDILTLSGDQLRRIRGTKVAYVPQDPTSALNPALRVGTQLRIAMRSHVLDGSDGDTLDARAKQVLDDVRLDHALLTSYPHQLSGGQQQRFCIAAAIAGRPDLIVFDEPTTGLDVSTQKYVLATVRRLCFEYQVAGVYVTHDLAVVSQVADRLAVMYAGRIVERGPTEEVFGSPAHPYTAALVRAVPSLSHAQTLEGIDGQPPTPRFRPSGCSFAPRCPLAVAECRAAPPAPVTLSGGRRTVRCIRAGELSGSSARSTGPIPEPTVVPDAVPTVSVSALTASYGDAEVLRDVELDVFAGECVAIVGESGSGKTTLARCVVGLHGQWSGNVSLGGQSVSKRVADRPLDRLRMIQYVFQNPYGALNPRHPIRQILEEPIRHFTDLSQSDRRARILTALDGVSLTAGCLGQYPGELSGGERQRVALARALVVNPEVIVCDEVTSALDVSVQAVVVELLRQLQAERELAVLFITHNVALVRTIAQRVVVLASGSVVERGRVADVLDHPTHEYTVSLLEDVPKLTAAESLRSTR
jgi:peptide/nickel transport system ATP-binding protein